jgi:asparagine synthase (glutamine-hydrolysing)
MGGIAGILNSDGSRIDPERLDRMLRSITGRGPETYALWHDGQAALGEVRPAAGPPASRKAPAHNADRPLCIAFDGEIYNAGELHSDLRCRGHKITTRGDAELVLAAFEEYGEDCVRHLSGQWALAIWDSRQRRLFASRDRLGTRPFYYAAVGREFVFGSRIKALWEHPGLAREIDLIGLDQVFTLRAALPPRTMFRHVFELPPGMSLYWQDGALTVFRHWQIDFAPDERQDDPLARESLCDLLTDATRIRLPDCPPVATHAGGCVASLLTTALVGRTSDAAPAPLAINFDEPDDGDDFPQNGASPPGAGQFSLHCSSADIGNVFPEVVRQAEAPFLTTDPAVMFLLSQFARDLGHDVLVSGTGGDELFGGCDIYKEAALRRFWSRQPASPARLRLLEQFFSEKPGPGTRTPAYWQAFFHVRPEDRGHVLFSHLARWEQTARLKTLFSEAVRAEIGDYDAREEVRLRLPARYKDWDALCRAQYLEMAHHLPGCILSSQHQRMLAAHGVTGRYPFLDHRVVDFATRLPGRSKLRGVSEQEILRQIASRFLCASQMRPRRARAIPPVASAFFGTRESPAACDYVDELLSRERIADAGLFDPTAVERLVHKARKGEATSPKDNLALAGVISTQLLVEQFVRQSPARHPVRQVS